MSVEFNYDYGNWNVPSTPKEDIKEKIPEAPYFPKRSFIQRFLNRFKRQEFQRPKDVIVYGTSYDNLSKGYVDFLKRSGYSPLFYDLSENHDLSKVIFNNTHSSELPITFVNNEYIIGLDNNLLMKHLNIKVKRGLSTMIPKRNVIK